MSLLNLFQSTNFFVVDENSYELKFVHSKKVHIFPIISIFALPNRNKIITNDTNGNKFVTKLTIKEVIPQTTQQSTATNGANSLSASDSSMLLQSQSLVSSTSFSPENSNSSFSTSQSQSQSQGQSQNDSGEIDVFDNLKIQQQNLLVDDACY